MGDTCGAHRGVSNGLPEQDEVSPLQPGAQSSFNAPPNQASTDISVPIMNSGEDKNDGNNEGHPPELDVEQEDTFDEEDLPPPLPPRPRGFQIPQARPTTPSTSLYSSASPKPSLQSKATTALSLTDIHTQSFPDGSRGTYVTASARLVTGFNADLPPADYYSGVSTRNPSVYGDAASIRSCAPTLQVGGDIESLMGEVLGSSRENPAWKLLSSQMESEAPFGQLSEEDKGFEIKFTEEFNEIEDLNADGSNEGISPQTEVLLNCWKSRLKHFLILSSAGKPIYTRHGDENLISGYIGVIQTIISFYHDVDDSLRGFTAGDARFVVMTEGPLYLVAISRLGESDSQLRTQLEALYMQILSTLTLPTLTHLFSSRPSTDLRRLLHGTEPLLSALADTFTRGSPPTLLSALECLKIRKAQRHVVNNTLLKARRPSLLYGLIVAGGRLVSVVRPKRHSLHPSDLQLIFNMLFEAESVKAGGGENWIPLCLPGFNKKGYLYMYVSFLGKTSKGEEDPDRPPKARGKEDEVAVILISADKESFYELQKMRDDVIQQLEKNGSMEIIISAAQKGRPTTTEMVPGTVLRHFLYKSRANVQFTMPAYEPHFNSPLERRKYFPSFAYLPPSLHKPPPKRPNATLTRRIRLISLYHTLHSSAHAKNAHLKVQHYIRRDSVSLAWVTPLFELYCVAGPNANRNALAQGANRVIQWVRREEERVFIVGGAVF
ncbi:MAG: Vacuolar fusion protein mon1 [Geoglossum simile]|nr:MAG: Vacuolar fusion protein mon1 [Geoglossum simile]